MENKITFLKMQSSTNSTQSPPEFVAPMKRTSSSTSKQQQDVKKVKLENDSLLMDKFGIKALQSVTINENFKAGNRAADIELKFLRNNFYLKANNGEEMDLFVCSNGALALFELLPEDIEVINRLTTFIIGKLKGDKEYHVSPVKGGSSAYFFHPDRVTKYFNKDGQSIPSLPSYAFIGKVRLRILGVTIYKKEEKLMVKPIIHLDQVKVERANKSSDVFGNDGEGDGKCVL